MVPAGGNPCRFVTKYRSRRFERFLTEEEFRRLGRVLDELEAEERLPVYAAAALRLLMLTGCRCSEIMTLRWEDVHLEVSEIRLRDSKTGPRVVPLSPAAARVLAGLPHAADNPWVIAGRKPGTRLSHIAYHWYRVRDRADLEDVRLHDLRHSFASRALALGESLPMIGKLLGHSKIQTTARYAHLARDSVQGIGGPGCGQHRSEYTVFRLRGRLSMARRLNSLSTDSVDERRDLKRLTPEQPSPRTVASAGTSHACRAMRPIRLGHPNGLPCLSAKVAGFVGSSASRPARSATSLTCRLRIRCRKFDTWILGHNS